VGYRGMRVKHSSFGEGEILELDGSGPNAKATVKFPSVGLKRIVVKFLSPA
jgi:DNA helicase II / ATP-dependent DNA helicase PcrA